MTTRYTVWTLGGRLPEWGEIRVKNVQQEGPDCWSVVVDGDGKDLVKFLKSRKDLFFCYLRVAG